MSFEPTVTITLKEYETLKAAARQPTAPAAIVEVPPVPLAAPAFELELAPVIVEKLLRGVTAKKEYLNPADFTELQTWLAALASHNFGRKPFFLSDLIARAKAAGIEARYEVWHFVCQTLATSGRFIYDAAASRDGNLNLTVADTKA